ncbi:metallophosphoesterase [Bacteroides sp. CAG:702]|nr:metallophosphoesterase [Bacteroides sp. CAG:702]
MNKKIKFIPILIITACLALTSCATASFSKYKGVGRIKRYEIYSEQVPDSFNGFRIAFASDFHYESRFDAKRLHGAIRALQAADADVLLLGGDYRGREGGDMEELFSALAQVKTRFGTYAVMGNHERGESDTLVRRAMAHTGVRLLEHKTDTLWKGNEYILICGIRNPFDLKRNGVSPTLALRAEDFVVMLVHTPDYVEDTDVSNTDLALAGHTHGGQVSLFRRWSPAHFSKYGNRFLTGLKHNSQGIPLIITNGLGTSRKDIRLFTPSEVVVVELKQQFPKPSK